MRKPCAWQEHAEFNRNTMCHIFLQKDNVFEKNTLCFALCLFKVFLCPFLDTREK